MWHLILRYLKPLAIYFLVGWFVGDVIQLCRGNTRPLSRKGIQVLCITQTQQHPTDSTGTSKKETTLTGFKLTFIH